MKVLETYKDSYGDKKQELIDLGYEFYCEKEKDIAFKPYMEDIEIIMCYNIFNKIDIRKFKKLKWIQLYSVGVDQISQEASDYIKEKNIILTNNKGGYSIPIGEWIVMNMLLLSRQIPGYMEKKRERRWEPSYDVIELYGKKAVLIGTGSIAQEAAKRLKPFQIDVLGVNTDGRKVPYFDECYSIKDLKSAVALGDFVVNVLPYTESTDRIINKEIFEAMKQEAYFINVARGKTVVEEELVKVLEQGRLKGAALDVFEKEPLPKENPLWKLNNVFITPHSSWVSQNGYLRRGELLYKNLKGFIELTKGKVNNPQEVLSNIVDFNKGY
ncbi:NAD(P)-dependent oxidoreductase [Alloiococcus sp. CFN-8]|uniref:NAD(P)-dependent oxidoreductase n=1 Tax=Alloiococcus sp. CFN-8 TaxID=3416081 RepID=UPI003CE695DA